MEGGREEDRDGGSDSGVVSLSVDVLLQLLVTAGDTLRDKLAAVLIGGEGGGGGELERRTWTTTGWESLLTPLSITGASPVTG